MQPYSPSKGRDHLNLDSPEDDPSLAPLIEAADQEASQMLASHPARGELGYCHLHWKTMKEILRQRHGIEWKSPADRHPEISFD